MQVDDAKMAALTTKVQYQAIAYSIGMLDLFSGSLGRHAKGF